MNATRDQLRAEFAMSTRRLELSVEQMKTKTTSQLAELGAGTVADHLPLHDALPLLHDRLLVDAGVLVGAAELGQRIDVRAELLAAGAQHARVGGERRGVEARGGRDSCT